MTTAPSAPRAASSAAETRPRRFPPVALVPPGHSARIIDALLMGLFVVRTPLPGLPVPVGQLSLIALIVICIFRRPVRSFGGSWLIPAAMILLYLFMVAETLFNGIDPTRRALNLAVLGLTALFIASGRVDVGSAIKGIAGALVVNAALFYAGLAPDQYQGRLTGFLPDKNTSALYLAVATFLLVIVIHRPWKRLAVIIVGSAAVIATDSRTTMAAFAAALIWYFTSRHLNTFFQAITLVVVVIAFFWADQNLAEIGTYAITREGSDAFRLRIDTASALKTASAPWYGLGLGEATVALDSGTWFFHNSYEALITEGGIVALITVSTLYASAGFGLFSRARVEPHSLESRAIAAATIVLTLCATRLGEVFFAPIGFVVLGVGLARLLNPNPTPSQPIQVG